MFLKDRTKIDDSSISDSLLAEIWGDEKEKFFENWYVPGLPHDFYPSSENLLFWIGEQLAKEKFAWSKLALEETCTSYAELKLDEFMVWYSNKYGLDESVEALSGWRKK